MSQRTKPGQKGERVAAYQNYFDRAGNYRLRFLGGGVYLGDYPNPGLDGQANPLIQLDSGDKVWGLGCWWGPEKQIEAEVHAQRQQHPASWEDGSPV